MALVVVVEVKFCRAEARSKAIAASLTGVRAGMVKDATPAVSLYGENPS